MCHCVRALPSLSLCALLLASIVGVSTASHVIYVDATSPNATDDGSLCWGNGGSEAIVPCATLDHALLGAHLFKESGVEVRLLSGEGGRGSVAYQLGENYTFEGYSDFALVGVDSTVGDGVSTASAGVVEIRCSSEDAGLSFVECRGLTFTNVAFSGCGSWRPSTNVDIYNTLSSPVGFVEFRVALYFLFSRDIRFSGVSVLDSPGAGAVFYGPHGINTIESCRFTNNSYIPIKTKDFSGGGGGLSIEFPFCDPRNNSCIGSNKTNVPVEFVSNSSFSITDSAFENNFANVSKLSSVSAHESYYTSFGKGAGMKVTFKGSSYGNTVVVRNCIFVGNKAAVGGGGAVTFQDSSTNNTFDMSDCRLEGNRCEYHPLSLSSGGGLATGYEFTLDHSGHSNHILLHNLTFVRNSAYFGAGYSFYSSEETDYTEPTNTVELSECVWEGNSARLGSAVDVNHGVNGPNGVFPMPTFTDCSFVSNNNYYNGGYSPMGTFYMSNLPVTFLGTTNFTENTGGALVAMDTLIIVGANATMNFYNNNEVAVGGAISLLQSFIHLDENSRMFFVGNRATKQGGAIYSYFMGKHSILGRGLCFVRYQDPLVGPEHWNTTVYFENNTAEFVEGGDDIYATSLRSCRYGKDLEFLFCSSQFVYEGKESCVDTLASSPADFNQSEYRVRTYMGHRVHLPITMTDDTNTSVSTVYNPYSADPDLEISDDSYYISANAIKMYGRPGTYELLLQTLEPRAIMMNVTVEMTDCPPGLTLRRVGGGCSCMEGYAEAIHCDQQEGHEAYILRGYWFGIVQNSSSSSPNGSTLFLNVTVAGRYPYAAEDLDYVTGRLWLPGSFEEAEEMFCNSSNREGVLCGRCIEGYGLVVGRQFACGKCSHNIQYYSWALFVAEKLVPITIFIAIIMLFNISVTKGPANGYIFFAQVVTTTFSISVDDFVTVNGSTFSYYFRIVYQSFYEVWNLDFFQSVLPSFCISSELSTLQYLLLQYTIGLYPFVIILVYFVVLTMYERGVSCVLVSCRPIHRCCFRLRRKWNVHRSIMDAFATCFIMSYMKLAVTSISILHPSSLYSQDGSVAKTVLYYDGSVEYLGREHIPYFVVAVAVLLFLFVPPIVLLFHSLKPAIKKLSARWACCARLLQEHPQSSKLQHLLETFHGCYKNGLRGTLDCRFFASLYFFLRLLFCMVYISSQWENQFVSQQIFCLLAIAFLAMVRPYRRNLFNNVDIAIFVVLAAINALSMFSYYYAVMGKSVPTLATVTQCVLILLPLLYISAYVAVHLWRKKEIQNFFELFLCCCSRARRRMRRRSYEFVDSDVVRSRGDGNHSKEDTKRMVTSDEYFSGLVETDRDLQKNTYRPPSSPPTTGDDSGYI